MLVTATLSESSISYLTPQERERLAELVRITRYRWTLKARSNQLPPSGDWLTWLILAGRGFGKTRSITEFAKSKAQEFPGSRGAIIGATGADVRDILIEGESGIKAISPPWFYPIYEPSKRRVIWPNGTIASLYSAEEPDRLRGPQFHWAICDELCSWKYPTTWDMLMFGMRLGENPQVGVATTPRPIKLLKELMVQDTTVVTRGATYENKANLSPAFFKQVVGRYEGTRLGRQELNAEILDDVPGALWKRSSLDDNRVTKHPDLVRIVVGVDPHATTGESGIVIAGKGSDGHGYVLDDLSTGGSPDHWARQTVTGYHKHKADRVAAEINNGGDMVVTTIGTVDKNVPVRKLWASRGKLTRAEPVAALYEQGKVHHVGVFAALEDELCNWVPGEGSSPNRLDALVWALTEVMLNSQGWARGSA